MASQTSMKFFHLLVFFNMLLRWSEVVAHKSFVSDLYSTAAKLKKKHYFTCLSKSLRYDLCYSVAYFHQWLEWTFTASQSLSHV